VSEPLDLVVIYDRPSDHPEHIVARRWEILPGQAVPREATLFDDLDQARLLMGYSGRMRMAPLDLDDPVIVEVWI